MKAYVRVGLRALSGDDPRRIEKDLRPAFSDSLALDDVMYFQAPRDSRWDYVLGLPWNKGPILVAIEIHNATAKDVDKILKKHGWAREVLHRELEGGSAKIRHWFWIASGKDGLSRSTTEWRRLVDSGVVFAGERLRRAHLSGA